ncbi:MAG: SDR family oxidoreductase [Leptolyngbyaceae cyanobacterium bins.302]|nr:SDR family oxidoreductase [Leptolyngbyaceae cyanobacterium bins.302]
MKAFVAGATGETGRRIVRELVDRQIPVRALVRNLDTAKTTLPEGVEFVMGDVLDKASLEAAIGDCTVVLCATGAKPGFDPTAPYRVDYEGTKNLVDVAKAKGVEQFVLVTSLCVSQFFHPLNLFFLILVWKKQAEEYLQKSGLSYTIVRPGGLKNADYPHPPVRTVMSKPDTLFEGSIPRLLVAKTCVAALFTPAAQNKVVEIVARENAPEIPASELFTTVA